MRLQDDRNGKGNQENIGGNIAHGHDDKLSITLTTLGTRIWDYLPVFVEWLAFCKSCDYHSDEGHNEEPPDELKAKFVGTFPYLTCDAFEEFRDGEFGDP